MPQIRTTIGVRWRVSGCRSESVWTRLPLGWWLDKKYGWSPWGIVAGSMLGLASGIYLMIKETLKNQD